MADNTLNISPPFKFEIKTPARGMTDYDPSAIHPEQQEQLNSYKLNLMRENISYLARHSEIKAILHWIGEYVWRARPRDVLGRVGKKFTASERELRRMVKEGVVFVGDDLVESESEDWDY